MKCPNCRCEIGNLMTCPYCGAILYRRTDTTQPAGSTHPRTTQPVRPAVTRPVSSDRSEQRKERHLANLDTAGLLCVVLLSGIFILELLQLLVILM